MDKKQQNKGTLCQLLRPMSSKVFERALEPGSQVELFGLVSESPRIVISMPDVRTERRIDFIPGQISAIDSLVGLFELRYGLGTGWRIFLDTSLARHGVLRLMANETAVEDLKADAFAVLLREIYFGLRALATGTESFDPEYFDKMAVTPAAEIFIDKSSISDPK